VLVLVLVLILVLVLLEPWHWSVAAFLVSYFPTS